MVCESLQVKAVTYLFVIFNVYVQSLLIRRGPKPYLAVAHKISYKVVPVDECRT